MEKESEHETVLGDNVNPDKDKGWLYRIKTMFGPLHN